ncbi:MAG: hypothetical protein J5517_10500 [Eubacterium sp.]|nr:hypothetical protein [Eubacterium sp.]
MQLKPIEPDETQNDVENGNGSSPQQSQPADPYVSNNEFFNPEQEFDVTAGDMFGNPIPNESQLNGQTMGQTVGVSGGPSYDPFSTNGAVYNPNAGMEQYDNPGNYGLNEEDLRPRKLSKKEFYISPRNRKDRDRIVISSIVVIIAAIVDLIRTDFWLSTFKREIEMVNNLAEQLGVAGEYMIDTDKIMQTQIIISVFLIALGLGILIFKSRACAITGLVLTVIYFIAFLVQNHQFRFYYTVIAFGYATLATISFANSWKEYEENGDWKREWKRTW